MTVLSQAGIEGLGEVAGRASPAPWAVEEVRSALVELVVTGAAFSICKTLASWATGHSWKVARAKARDEEIGRLRAALKPFAELADEYSEREDASFQVWKDFNPLGAMKRLTLAKFRSARAVLQGVTP